MRFARPAIGTFRPGMAGMTVAFVGDGKHQRRRGLGQFSLNGLGDAHPFPIICAAIKVKHFVFLSFTGGTP